MYLKFPCSIIAENGEIESMSSSSVSLSDKCTEDINRQSYSTPAIILADTPLHKKINKFITL